MAAAALSVFGGVTASIDLVKTGTGMCIALRDSLNNYKDLQDQAGQICGLYAQVEADLKKIETGLNGRENNEGIARAHNLDQDSDGDHFETLAQATREEISAANNTVRELNNRLSQASEAKQGSSSRWPWKSLLKLKTVALDATGVIDISSSLKEVRTCVQNAARNCTYIKTSRLILGRLNEIIPHETPDVFKAYFDEPSLSHYEVLDFESCNEEGYPITAEGRLRREVLELLYDETVRGVPASGKQGGAAHGMGGVGKTTTLRALCQDEQVKQAYSDGICFLEFGQDADDRKVIKQVARCMRVFGGRSVAQQMKEASPLSDVLEKGADFLRERKVLLVCDDIWTNEKVFGYVPDLTKLLRKAPRSKLLISTRDRNIADKLGMSVEFAPLDPKDSKAMKILLAAVPDIDQATILADKDAFDHIQRVLEFCAGHPLALAIAGRGLEKSVRRCNSLSNGVRQFCELLEHDSERITVAELEHYPGFTRVIESSLRQCQQWGSSDKVVQQYGRQLDMISMFKGLCVLEKQMIMPKRVLKRIWNTNDRCANAVMEMFSDSSLVNLVESELSTQQEFGLRLHDLVLLRCQLMAGHECIKFHKRIVDAYSEKLINSEEESKSKAWWDADDDGYVFAHLSRHLALSGESRELEFLLCDIRWTMRRLRFGEWPSLKVDFECRFSLGEQVGTGMSRVYNVLNDSWPYARKRHDLLAFCIFAHLSREEREEKEVARLLSSIDHHFPKPWLRPETRCLAVKDPRELWKEVFSGLVSHTAVDWTRGNIIAAAYEYIFLWSTEQRRTLWVIQTNARAIARSEDGMVFVSATTDNTLRRWDVQSGAPIGDPLVGHEDSVYCVAISSDGNFIVSGSRDETIRRWDVQSGAPIGDPLVGHEHDVECVAISSDGNVIVSGSIDGIIRRWDARSGAPIGDPLVGHKDSVVCVAISSDGNVIVSGSFDKTIRRWDTQSGAPIGDPLVGHVGSVECVAISSDSNVIVSGSRDRTIRSWDCQSGAPIGYPFRGHAGTVNSVAISSDGNVTVSGSRDKTIRHWDARIGAPIGDPLVGHVRNVECVAISSEGNVIVSGSRDETIRRWDARIGAPIGDQLVGHDRNVECVAISSEGNIIVSGSSDKTVRRWDARSGASIGDPLVGHEFDVKCVAISSDGNVIVSGSIDGIIRRWDARSGAPIGDPLVGHKDSVVCVAISSDGNVIVSGSFDKTIRRWDTQSGAPIGDPLVGHKDNVNCVAISSDGMRIVSASGDKTVRCWDAQSGAPIGDPLVGHEDSANFVAISSDGNIIVSGSSGSSIRLWSRKTRKSGEFSAPLQDIFLEKAKFSAPYTCLAMDFIRHRIILGQSNGCIVICRLMV